MRLAVILWMVSHGVVAFTVLPVSFSSSTQLQRHVYSCFYMNGPKYDSTTQRWSDSSGESGYGPIGSLLRQGPVPFLQRIKDPDGYQQGVLKMMAKEQMSREEAQGNMDAYLQNPNDWVLQKLEDKNSGKEYDYANANMEPHQLVLTGLWSTGLLVIAGRVLFVGINGCDTFCQANHF